jgi:hypothetical protein
MGQGGQVRGHQAAVISASSVECTQISRHLAFGNPVEGRFGSVSDTRACPRWRQLFPKAGMAAPLPRSHRILAEQGEVEGTADWTD